MEIFYFNENIYKKYTNIYKKYTENIQKIYLCFN